MAYYDLCKQKQKEHITYWAQQVGEITIPEFDIKKETMEDRTILRDKKWGTKAKRRDYMMSQGYNKENTKLLILIIKVVNSSNLNFIFSSQKQKNETTRQSHLVWFQFLLL